MKRPARAHAVALAVMILMIASQLCRGETRPSDYTLTKRVEQAISGDLRLRQSEIKVKTLAGNVTLSGTVPSYFEKVRAQWLCERVDGVEAVRSKLRVQLLRHSDDETALAIQQRFRHDVVLRSQELKVEVHRRIVTIQGEVEDNPQRQRAEQLAREIPGVTVVHNDVQPVTTSRLDEVIRAAVVADLDRDDWLLGFPISISVDRGKVTLQGIVRYRWQRELAGSRSQSVRGVHEVDNRLEVMINNYLDEGDIPSVDHE